MNGDNVITFVSHTNKPGGGELALRRYLEATRLPVRLVTMEAGGVWEGLRGEVVEAPGLRRLRLALRGEGLVVANSMRAALLTGLVMPRGGRLVYWVRDGLTNSAMTPLALALTRSLTARRITHYLANSEWTARTIDEALGVTSDRIDVVHSMSGLSAETLKSCPRSTPHIPLRLLFVGRLSPWKAPEVAVRALKPLREMGIEATLTIAGGALFDEDEYVKRLRSIVAKEPTASMLGHVDDVQQLLGSHDVLVHCSTVPEPFGQVIVQGLAAGMPVLATAHGGPVSVLGPCSASLLYDPGEHEALAQAISGVLSDYAAISAWSCRRATDYADAKLARRTDSVLARLRQN